MFDSLPQITAFIAFVAVLFVNACIWVPTLRDQTGLSWAAVGLFVASILAMLIFSITPEPSAQIVAQQQPVSGVIPQRSTPSADISWLGLLSLAVPLAIAGWVGVDAAKRRASIVWPIGTFFFWLILIPIWKGCRPLLVGEERYGGTAWSVLRELALWNTIYCLGICVFLISFSMSVGGLLAGFGMAFLIAGLWWWWLAATVTFLLIGYLLRQDGVVEKGVIDPVDHTITEPRAAPPTRH